MLKITPIAVWLLSKCFTSDVLYTLVAYACPMQRWTASAAGGIIRRLYPGGATVCSRSSTDKMPITAPSLVPQLVAPRASWLTVCIL